MSASLPKTGAPAHIDGQHSAFMSHQASNYSKLTWWQRLRQYQPSIYLVRILFGWWLLIMLATALKITDGFDIALLEGMVPLLFDICYMVLVALIVVCAVEWLWLMVASQANHYQVMREYPSNVPIFHQLNIKAFLGFDATEHNDTTPKLVQYTYKLFDNMGLINSIDLDYSDDFPNQLMLVDTVNNIEDITSEKTVMSTVMAIPVRLKLTKLKNSNNDTENVTNDSQDSASNIFNKGHNSVQISYPVLPVKRGTGYFGDAYLRVWSPFKLLHRRLNVKTLHTNEHYLRVLADFSNLLSNELAAMFEKSPHAGLQAMMQQGNGSDFLNLREYAAGDAIRQIDWKSSSRHRRLMSKAYEDDNDQDVVFMLDCGEQMRHQNDDSNSNNNLYLDAQPHNQDEAVDTLSERQLNYFDKVLNSVLMLSYVANKQSDRVGLMTFGGVDTYLPPKKGVALIRNLLNETADIMPTMQTSDYLLAAQTLNRHLKKRSLIILITNTRVEASDELMQAVQLLARKHQIVFANLTEQIVYDRLHGNIIPTELDDALLYHSLYSYEEARLQLHHKITHQTGALCLHTTANQLPAKLTQAYLSLKR